MRSYLWDYQSAIAEIGWMQAESVTGSVCYNHGEAKPKSMPDEIADFVSRLPQKQTPNNTLADRYEIKHTGSINYLVSGGGTEIWIDGYRGTIILDAKFVGQPDISPYIPGSRCFHIVRQNVATQQASEFLRLSNAINDPNTPFNSIEVITNEPAAIPYFEDFLSRFNIPGQVVIQP